jgi:hypothetical protein
MDDPSACGYESRRRRLSASVSQKHDADLNDCTEHQGNGKTNIDVSKPRAAPIESLIELFAFFAHASSQSGSGDALEAPQARLLDKLP